MSSRTRERGMFNNMLHASHWWNSAATPPAITWTTLNEYQGTKEWCTDIVTKNFAKLRAQGRIINNPFYKAKIIKNVSTEGPWFKTTAGGITYHGQLLGPWGDFPHLVKLKDRVLPDYQSLIAETRTRALSKVERPSYEGLVAIGELRETLSYLRNPFKAGLKLARTLDGRMRQVVKKRNIRSDLVFDGVSWRERRSGKILIPNSSSDYRKAARELGSIYLEFRYALRPLVYDIESALDAYESKRRSVERQTFRARGYQNHKDSWTINEKTVESSSISYDANYNYERSITINAGVLYGFTAEQSTQSKWGMNMAQLPSALWELMPLSFVSDWFLNIGQYIAAVSPVPGASQLAGWTIIRIDQALSVTRSNWKFSNWTTHSQGSGTDSIFQSTIHRIPTIGVPSLVVKANALSTFSDPFKVADMALIAAQILRGHTPHSRT